MSTQVYTTAESILEIRELSIDYPISIGTVGAVERVSFQLYKGEALGLVGESGCGKSTLGLSILKLVRPPGKITGGQILYKGQDIVRMPDRQILKLRGQNIAMAFQNPLTSLNPLFRIDRQFLETIHQHEPGIGKNDALNQAESILEELGIEPSRLYEYPHQLSGGMRQRIMLGLGLIMNPDIIVADEPTTSLDVIVEAGFIDLLNRLRRRYNLSILLITHNLGLVAEIADRVAVMYAGKIVEIASADQIFHQPLHPYTYGLINCVPNIRLDQEELLTMPGNPPDLVNPPKGCRFSPRCPKVMDICRKREPELKAPTADRRGSQRSDRRPSTAPGNHGRVTACWLYQEEEDE
jgi:oligopeptide/dipeptide ABC transporter ATP-binding protein